MSNNKMTKIEDGYSYKGFNIIRPDREYGQTDWNVFCSFENEWAQSFETKKDCKNWIDEKYPEGNEKKNYFYIISYQYEGGGVWKRGQ